MNLLWTVLISTFLVAVVVESTTDTKTPLKQQWTVPEGSRATLLCPLGYLEEESTPTNDKIVWFLPNGTKVTNNDEIQIGSKDSLIINATKPIHSGEYVCVSVENHGPPLHSAITKLEVIPAPVVLTTWEENKPRVIRGGIAAGVLVFLFVSVCLVYRFRWQKPKKLESSAEAVDAADGVQVLSEVRVENVEDNNVNCAPRVHETTPTVSSKVEHLPEEMGKSTRDSGDHQGTNSPKVQVQYAVEEDAVEHHCAADLDGESPQPSSYRPKSPESQKDSPSANNRLSKESQIQYAAERQVSAPLDEVVPEQPKGIEAPMELQNAQDKQPSVEPDVQILPKDAGNCVAEQPPTSQKNIADTGF